MAQSFEKKSLFGRKKRKKKTGKGISLLTIKLTSETRIFAPLEINMAKFSKTFGRDVELTGPNLR